LPQSIPILALGVDDAEIERRMQARRARVDLKLLKGIIQIAEDVRSRRDEAILEATLKWDRVKIESVVVSEEEMRKAEEQVDARYLEAMEAAAQRIEKVNRRIKASLCDWSKKVAKGVTVGEKVSPLESAGLWVPCSKGALASAMLMLAVPAKVAGVDRIVGATPPRSDGSVEPSTLAAARVAGVDLVLKGNGVALVAALAFGTESVPKVDAVYGPGPPAINLAMGYVAMYGVRIGPPMGPSECVVLASDDSDPVQVAADLLNECEHGPDSSCVLVTDSHDLASKVSGEVNRRVESLPQPRKDYVRSALSSRGMIIVSSSLGEAARFVNRYAPEHLQIALPEDRCGEIMKLIRNAGEILFGQMTPFSAANYAMGTTAVLPTGGSAKGHSGITVRDFLKFSTTGALDEDGLKEIWPIVSALGELEGFPAHVDAARIKMEKVDEENK